MSHRLIVEAGAEDDVDVAYRWYEEQSSGLGGRVLGEIESPDKCLNGQEHDADVARIIEAMRPL